MTDVEDGTAAPPHTEIVLKELPDAMDSIVYVKEKWPFILDTTGQAARFLKYQAGNYHNAMSASDMTKEVLRKSLVGCLKYGHDMTIDLGATKLELEQFWDPDHFPKELLHRSPLVVNTPEFWAPLLRQELGDPAPEKFETKDGFRLVVVSAASAEQPPRVPLTMARMGVLKVVASKTKVRGGAEAEMAMACGVKLIKRNQKKMCEAAFEGELEEVQGWLEKGYDLESTDAHNHTPLSEAAAKGHIEVVEYLLDQGRWVDVFVGGCWWLPVVAREDYCFVQGRTTVLSRAVLSGTILLFARDCACQCHWPKHFESRLIEEHACVFVSSVSSAVTPMPATTRVGPLCTVLLSTAIWTCASCCCKPGATHG